MLPSEQALDCAARRATDVRQLSTPAVSLATPGTSASMPMRYNKLGDSGLLVSELSYGAWVTFMVSTVLV